jgi:Mg2+/Co2+ transporter CorB
MDIFLTFAAIVVLVVLSAFFSGSETALTAARRSRIHQLEMEGDKRASLAARLIARRERLIGAILLGNNLVNILASALAAGVMIHYMGDAGIAYATVAMTVVVVIFAEVLPKTYAIRHADRTALLVAPVLRPIVGALGPVTLAVQIVVLQLLRAFGAQRDGTWKQSLADEIRGMIDYQSREGTMRKHYRDMLKSVLDLAEVEVGEVIVHRRDMVTLNADSSPKVLVKEVLDGRHTRFPVWKGNPDNIQGVLHAKSLLREVDSLKGDLSTLEVLKLCTEPWFVPGTTSLADQLAAFRAQRSHFALVVDEYGALLGMVTLDDILEEIVGDIADENDSGDPQFESTATHTDSGSDGSFILDGVTTIRNLNRAMEWTLPDEDAATLAGLVIHEAKRIPRPGQVFLFFDFRFEILEREGNRITKLRVSPSPHKGAN